MNTPEPCSTCRRLYVNALCKDDPTYLAECFKGHAVGEDPRCPDYRADHRDEERRKRRATP